MSKTLNIDNLQKNVSLAAYTTFKIGGPARYFVIAKTKEEIYQAVKAAREAGVDFFILGGGSNLLVSDAGYDGLVIKNEYKDLKITGQIVRVGSGAILNYLIFQTVEQGLAGLENLVGIPGTIGGAVRGNAGAYGVETGRLVTTITATDGVAMRQFSQADCNFGYRTSLFKETNWVALEIALELSQSDPAVIRQKMQSTNQARQSKIPWQQPSAGSVFKNLEIKDLDLKHLQAKLRLTDVEFSELTKYQKVAAGYLIDWLGLKGFSIGGAQISEQHSNFIINTGQATADDVIKLISFIKQRVRAKIGGIALQEEIQYLGF
ncbi:MAG: UDP-N-acetylmuramate dehydrogenase [Patescibacteria group bacterium]